MPTGTCPLDGVCLTLAKATITPVRTGRVVVGVFMLALASRMELAELNVKVEFGTFTPWERALRVLMIVASMATDATMIEAMHSAAYVVWGFALAAYPQRRQALVLTNGISEYKQLIVT